MGVLNFKGKGGTQIDLSHENPQMTGLITLNERDFLSGKLNPPGTYNCGALRVGNNDLIGDIYICGISEDGSKLLIYRLVRKDQDTQSLDNWVEKREALPRDEHIHVMGPIEKSPYKKK